MTSSITIAATPRALRVPPSCISWLVTLRPATFSISGGLKPKLITMWLRRVELAPFLQLARHTER